MSFVTKQIVGSYFGLSFAADLVPSSEITAIFENDIFKLDTNTGDLSPNVDGGVSQFFEIDANDDIITKVL